MRTSSGSDHHTEREERRGAACFGCGPGQEALAAELARLVDGTWALTPGVRGVMLLANGAKVPQQLPGHASREALTWWHTSVRTALTPARR